MNTAQMEQPKQTYGTDLITAHMQTIFKQQQAAFDAQQAIQANQGLRQLAGTAGGIAAGYYGQKQTPAEFDAAHAKKFGVTG